MINIEYITLPFLRIRPYIPGISPFDPKEWPNEPMGEITVPVVTTSEMSRDDILLKAIKLRDALFEEWLQLGNCRKEPE